jgi:hypothetical protein
MFLNIKRCYNNNNIYLSTLFMSQKYDLFTFQVTYQLVK